MASTPTKAELRALPKKQRRIVAREVARAERAAEAKRRRRRRVAQQAVAALAAVGVVVAAVFGVQSWVKSLNRGPLNMISDGVQIGGDGTTTYAATTPALAQGADPEPSTANRIFGVLDTVMYVDYSDPESATLWATAGKSLTTAVSSGQATLEVHPIAPTGSQSSVLAGAALGCVAELAPAKILAAHVALLAGTDWTASSLTEAMRGAGITDKAVATCIDHGRFTGFVKGATARAKASVPFDAGSVSGTTLILAGVAYDGAFDDATAFTAALTQAWAVVAEESAALSGDTSGTDTGASASPSASASADPSASPSASASTDPSASPSSNG